MRYFSFVLSSFLFVCSLSYAGPEFQRVSLITFSIEGYAPYNDKRMYLDAGVHDVNGACELLTARAGSRAAQQAWTPLDFYGNQVGGGPNQQPGESDLFFAGDEHNREAGTIDASATLTPDPYLLDSFDFDQARRAKDWLSFNLGFTRGYLVYHTLIGVRAFRDGDHCSAMAVLCAKPVAGENGSANCEADGWTKHVTAVIAAASISGALRDRFRTIHRDRERHDIASLDGVISDQSGSHRERLAGD